MKRLLLICCLITNTAIAQYSDKVWCFGDSAGINFSNPNNPQTFTSQVKFSSNYTSVADSIGNLIFYVGANNTVSNQNVKIFSSNNTVIQNGDSILSSFTIGLTSIPYPNIKNRFIVFTNLYWPGNNGLFYSIFDMDSTYTNGTVLVKNISLLPFAGGDITAIRHGNGRDWWIITKSLTQLNGIFNVFLATPSGIQGPFNQSISTPLSYSPTHSCFRFNNKGDEMIYLTTSGLIEKYDFDRCTGLLSNKITILNEVSINQPPQPFYFSACFASNDSILYVTSGYAGINYNGNNLYQINLKAPILTLDSLYHFSQPVSVGILKLASNNKIFLASISLPFSNQLYTDTDYNLYNTYLSVINEPNKLGTLCDLQPFSFYLGGKRTYWDLPNNPNYNLGALVGSICDTLFTGIAPEITANAGLTLNYIVDWQKLIVNATRLYGKNCTLKLYSTNGSLVYQSKANSNPPFFTAEINCTGMATGVYILNLTTELESVTGKFFKE